ncbi:MAG: SDR family NAD(P)-dependent oxidoreductase [Alphaproteobacteria bacterium]|nr:MAG: SDR family NAD(P)-dependent oxidoreductase [Alphaproteobacteria bacterium]
MRAAPDETPRPLALITGASGGIGAAFAKLLAAEGFDLLLVARRRSALNEVAADCQVKGAAVQSVVCDLTDPASGALLEAAVRSEGRLLNLLVNNAGYGLMTPVGSAGLEEELGIVDLNVRAVMELSLRFLPDLRQTGGGLINLSSLVAFRPLPYFSAYSASKAYVQTFSELLGRELAHEGVRVLALCPGYTKTGFQQRAGADVGAADRYVPKHSPERVARDGWRAYQRGRRVKIVGLGNWTMARFGFLVAPFVGFAARKAYAHVKRLQVKGEDHER